ncbi:MAG: hypothetical protein U0414_30960 [Polyangiaceae bacterium]
MNGLRARLRSIAAAGLLVVASSTGCTSYGRVGPPFVPSASVDEGKAVIYVFRPKKAFGAILTFVVTLGNREFVLNPGAYGALIVPEGTVSFLGNANPIEVTANHAAPTYVRVEFDSLVDSWAPWKGGNWKTDVVSEPAALSELSDIGLAPGGRGRYDDATNPEKGAALP